MKVQEISDEYESLILQVQSFNAEIINKFSIKNIDLLPSELELRPLYDPKSRKRSFWKISYPYFRDWELLRQKD